MKIVEIKGDLLRQKTGIITHQVNASRKMGSGVADQVRKQFPVVYEEYMKLFKKYSSEELMGRVQLVSINDKLSVANLFGQLNYGYGGEMYTDYKAVRKAFRRMAEYLKDNNDKSDIHIPYKMGCDRGGGDWEIYLGIIKEELASIENTMYVVHYDRGI